MLDKKNLDKCLNSDDKVIVARSILEMVFNANIDEISWVSERLIELTRHNDQEIRGLSAISFGHLARLHNSIGSYEIVVKLLKNLTRDPNIGGIAEDSLDDIETFMKK